jgi:hypothetical protein
VKSQRAPSHRWDLVAIVFLSRGLHVWRIEKMNPIRVNHANYGDFNDGDGYVVLHV